MDQGIIGSIYTVIVFVAFIGAVWWAFNSRNKDKFDDAANIIFEDDEPSDSKLSKKDQES
ncbi:MAG: cytochrome c oxidase cbb3-type subunit 4 [Kangiellaceae bacterium]|jgi:cytochrome c oxidase cbb3-type subunit 4